MPVTDSSCVDAVTLWDLCNALWGSVMPDDDIASETSYVCQRARREAVSHWLTSCSASHISTEIQSANLKVVHFLVLFLLPGDCEFFHILIFVFLIISRVC